MRANFAAVQTMAVLIFLPSSVSSTLDRQSHQLLWQTVAKNFSHIRFCRPNARWLSLLGDFVTTNFGTGAPRARAPLEQCISVSIQQIIIVGMQWWIQRGVKRRISIRKSAHLASNDGERDISSFVHK